jgi:hypothetical protein
MDVHNAEMLQALAVRYVITHEGASSQPWLAGNPDFSLVGSMDSFYIVYEYRLAKPPGRWEDERLGSAQTAFWSPERRDFLVQSERGGRFALIEQYFPGWHATVDGRPVPTERWNGTFQAIAVPPGEHRLRFEYRPASLRTGAIVSLAALAALLAVAVSDRRRRRANTRETTLA